MKNRWERSLAPTVVALSLACASTHRVSRSGVEVYEADAAAPAADRALPVGCRLLGSSGPVDQMESERVIDDPYRKQRREAAEKGGNVLLVLSRRTVTRPNPDCPSGDTSADCLRRAENWYRVAFEQYACDAESVAALKALPPAPPAGGLTVVLASPKPKMTPGAGAASQPPASTGPATAAATPAALTASQLKAKIVEMMREKVAAEVILAYVRGQRLSGKMTAEEIIDWTRSGIPDAVIEAAAASR